MLGRIFILGIVITCASSCSDKDTAFSPKTNSAGKLALNKFQPTPGTDYDPYKNANENERKIALGHIEGATSYFELIIVQLAKALNDKNAREVIYNNTPTWDNGEIKLSKLAVDNPALLEAMGAGFKRSVAEKGVTGQLAQLVQETPFDEKALLWVLEAMFDIEVTLVNPPAQKWAGSEPISVFYIPMNDGAAVISGVDSKLKKVTLSADITEAPYPFLSVNFDEDPHIKASTSYGWPEWNVWDFFVTSAYAHTSASPNHCRHKNVMAPALEIMITKDHEPGFWNKPEIEVLFFWDSDFDIRVTKDTVPLPDVDYENVVYKYPRKRTAHGPCIGEHILEIRVIDNDIMWDDTVSCWKGVYPSSNVRTLRAADSACSEKDAYLKIQKTGENSAHAARGGGGSG